MLLSEKIANSSPSELEKYTLVRSGQRVAGESVYTDKGLVSCRFSYPTMPGEGDRFKIKLSDVLHLIQSTGRLKGIYFGGLLNPPFEYLSFDFLNEDGKILFAAAVVNNDNHPNQPRSATVDIVVGESAMFCNGRIFLDVSEVDDVEDLCDFRPFFTLENGLSHGSIKNMMLFVCASLAIMNIKGACELTPVVHDEKLQKARKKRSKPPLSNYTYINCLFNRSVSTRQSEAGASVTRAAHTVRGHFKRCKNGVFWWKPHIAGSGTLKQRKAYVIKP